MDHDIEPNIVHTASQQAVLDPELLVWFLPISGRIERKEQKRHWTDLEPPPMK